MDAGSLPGMRTQLTKNLRAPTYVIGSSLAEIVKIENTRISN